MNVCLLTRFFDFRGTGVSRIATEVKTELERMGHFVHPISTNGTNLYTYFWYTGVQIPCRLPRRNVDVYHALATLEAMWLPRHKSVATFLDLFTTTNPERAGSGMGYNKLKLAIGRWYFDLGSKLAVRCRFLTCISDKTKQDMIQFLHIPESKIHTIHLGIPNDLEPQPRKHSRFIIGTLGQLDKRKRVDLLIRQFKASRIDADLVIAGQGMDYPLLKELADEDPRIRFLGLVPNEKLCEFYNSLDLFVFPTFLEGWGLPPVEAMACEKPVVIMDDAIMPHEVRSRCVSVENLTPMFDDYGFLSSAIASVDYTANYQWAKSHTWQKCVEQYTQLYRQCQD